MHIADQFPLPMDVDETPTPFEHLEPEAALILQNICKYAPRKFLAWDFKADGSFGGFERPELMARNGRCWCGGKKFKQCHGKPRAAVKVEVQEPLPMVVERKPHVTVGQIGGSSPYRRLALMAGLLGAASFTDFRR